jgi:3-oxoacyl-[acyl-carrier protein] reductase
MTSDAQVIIVSGGSRGLGQALVQHLLGAGHSVATFSRSSSPFVDALSRDPQQDRFFFTPLDAADSQQLVKFVRRAHDRFGRLDALVNNAALVHDGVLAMATEDQIQQMLDVNLRGAIVLARECVRVMLCQGSGSIVNISSIIAQRGYSGLSVYAATKAGLIGLTRSLAREVGPKNIRVNAIAPGYLETDMSRGLDQRQRAQIVRRTPLGRLGTAEDVIPVLDFLLSPASRFITGQVIAVDGGASV